MFLECGLLSLLCAGCDHKLPVHSWPRRGAITYPTILEPVKVSTASVVTGTTVAIAPHISLGQVHQRWRTSLAAPIVPQQLQQMVGQFILVVIAAASLSTSSTASTVTTSSSSSSHVVVATSAHSPVVGRIPWIHVAADGASVVVAIKVSVAVRHRSGLPTTETEQRDRVLENVLGKLFFQNGRRHLENVFSPAGLLRFQTI